MSKHDKSEHIALEYADKCEYIKEAKRMLLEDCNTHGDISPNIVKVKTLHNQYQYLPKDLVEQMKKEVDWLETYFMRCRHCARPIDKELATKIISSLDYI